MIGLEKLKLNCDYNSHLAACLASRFFPIVSSSPN